MTPKSLLRLPRRVDAGRELTTGRSSRCSTIPRAATAPDAVRRVVLCSGKIYYDLVGSELRRAHAGPRDRAASSGSIPSRPRSCERVLARYPNAERVAWVQEEPRNMGARKFVMPKIRHLVPYQIPLGDIRRPERSRPAEGYPAAHAHGAGAHRARSAHELMPRHRPLLERYRDLLARPGERFPITLGEGGTPLIHARAAGRGAGARRAVPEVRGHQPDGLASRTAAWCWRSTGRVAGGARAVICASTGNTSASAAAYAAAAGLACFVVLPAGKVARGKLAQALAAGRG